MLAVLGLSVAVATMWEKTQRSAPSPAPAPAAAESVSVYYFHGSIRCQKCLEIERVSREIVLSYYEDDIAAGRMSWQSVDYMLPANEHFFDEFNLKLPSLAVECRKGGIVRRTVLTNTWEKVEVQEDLEAYVINGIECFRNGQGGVPVPQASRP